MSLVLFGCCLVGAGIYRAARKTLIEIDAYRRLIRLY